MRAGLRIATASALWGSAFLALAHLHVVPEKSLAPVFGAVLWLVACLALARTRPRGQARRLVVTTAAVAVALLAASIIELVIDKPLVPEILAAVALLATMQCFAATMAEISYDLKLHRHEMSWELTGRFLFAVDIASMGVALAWATDLVERRSSGRFRVTDVDLAPVNVAGRACLIAYVAVLAVAGARFALSTGRMFMWARTPEDAPARS
jgi:hypothetical protein